MSAEQAEPQRVKSGRTGQPDAEPRAGSARRGRFEDELYKRAAHLFAERGFAGTSLQDIADAMGVTRPALYYYVKSKDELLAKLVLELTGAAAGDLRAAADRDDLDSAGKLRQIVRIIVGQRTSEPARFRLLIMSEAELPEDLARSNETGRRAVLRTITDVIRLGMEQGHFHPMDPRVAAFGVLGMCNWVAWWFLPEGRVTAEEVAEQIADMAVAALQRRQAESPAVAGPEGAVLRMRQELDHLERLLKSS